MATNDVRDKLDVVESSLPDDVENPIIFKFGTDDIPILLLSVTAEESTNALYKLSLIHIYSRTKKEIVK